MQEVTCLSTPLHSKSPASPIYMVVYVLIESCTDSTIIYVCGSYCLGYIYICCVDAICIYIILRICIHIVFYSHLIYSVLANWQPYFVWVLIQSNLQAMILGFRVVKSLGFRPVSQTRCRGPEPCKPKPGGRQSTGG